MQMHLKAARVNAGLTQTDVCRSEKIAISTLSRWEAEKTFPTSPQLKRLCNLYGCKLDDIFVPETLTIK